MELGSLLGGAAQVAGSIGSLVGARKDKLAAENAANKSWQRNYEAQKEFAQNSIQWRVQDAKAAGINPYAAIGGQMSGYTPQDTSYQTSYQQGVSQAMNHLSDAMGQLNMASVAEDIKGKKLDNEKKTLELINKAVKDNLGQVPKTFTNPFQKVIGANYMTDATGHQYPFPDAEASLDDLSGLAQAAATMYNVDAADRIRDAAGDKGGEVGLGALGVRHAPKGTRKLDPPNVKAANIARDYGTITGLLSLPSLWLQNGISAIERSFRRRKKPNYERR